jgi:DNA recombination protein RmuC
VQAAVAEARASGQVELATLTERLSASSAALESERGVLAGLRKTSDAWRDELESTQQDLAKVRAQLEGSAESLQTERAQHQSLSAKAEAWRAALDESSNEMAKLTERVSAATAAHQADREQLAELRAVSTGWRTELDAAQQELSKVRAQLQGTSETLQAEREEHRQIASKAEGWRTSLDEVTNDMAALTERAARVPQLEQELAASSAALKSKEGELLRVSTDGGQNAEKAIQLARRLSEVQGTVADLTRRYEVAVGDLQRANEARASLEQQAVRVAPLEADVATLRNQLAGVRDDLTTLREGSGREAARLSAELVAEREAHSTVRQEAEMQRTGREELNTRFVAQTEELTELRTRTDNERQHAAEKLQLLVEAKEALSNQFKSLAAEILEDKSKRFAEQNQVSLDQLLGPLRTQLTDFKGKVEEVYVQEGKDRTALTEQVKQLMALNQTLSQDANNLTRALKGQAKTQGSWGELILERVLEASGLKKGSEYRVQDSQQREDGTRAQPDVVIELPEERKLVVDAKVSLVAYERYVSAENDAERDAASKHHLESIRSHIKGLSEKRYNELYGQQSPDFVLAFIPVEPAFMLAVAHDNELFMDAWSRNVLLVSPSTLLFVVRTVAHLWRQEHQSRNAQEIAKRGAELYDKLCGFVTDLQKVGERLNQAQSAFSDANSKLVAGKGNVIRQAEMLRELGVKPSKSLPAGLVQAAIPTTEIVVPALAVAASGHVPHPSADTVIGGFAREIPATS